MATAFDDQTFGTGNSECWGSIGMQQPKACRRWSSASTPSASAARALEASRARAPAPRRTVPDNSVYECTTQTVFASGLDWPTGLALADDVLYVAEHEAGPFEGASGARLGAFETDQDYARSIRATAPSNASIVRRGGRRRRRAGGGVLRPRGRRPLRRLRRRLADAELAEEPAGRVRFVVDESAPASRRSRPGAPPDIAPSPAWIVGAVVSSSRDA